MDYQKIYDQLILKVRSENRGLKREKGFHIHHILPKSMGGFNEKENLIKLTLKEHFIIHELLWEITKDFKMLCALWYMANRKEYWKCSPRTYEKLNILVSEKRSKNMKGENNYWFGKEMPTKICNYCNEEFSLGTYERWHGEKCIKKSGNEDNRKGEKSLNFGKKFSKEWCSNISKTRKRKIKSGEIKIISIKMYGKDNPAYIDISKNIQNEIINLYNKGYTPKMITEKTGIKKIRKILSENNIKLRTNAESHKLLYNLGFISPSKGIHHKKCECLDCHKFVSKANFNRWHKDGKCLIENKSKRKYPISVKIEIKEKKQKTWKLKKEKRVNPYIKIDCQYCNIKISKNSYKTHLRKVHGIFI